MFVRLGVFAGRLQPRCRRGGHRGCAVGRRPARHAPRARRRQPPAPARATPACRSSRCSCPCARSRPRASSANADAADVRRAHADHYVRLAAEAEPLLHGRPRSWPLDRLEAERDNLRAAFRHLHRDRRGRRGRRRGLAAAALLVDPELPPRGEGLDPGRARRRRAPLDAHARDLARVPLVGLALAAGCRDRHGGPRAERAAVPRDGRRVQRGLRPDGAVARVHVGGPARPGAGRGPQREGLESDVVRRDPDVPRALRGALGRVRASAATRRGARPLRGVASRGAPRATSSPRASPLTQIGWASPRRSAIPRPSCSCATSSSRLRLEQRRGRGVRPRGPGRDADLDRRRRARRASSSAPRRTCARAPASWTSARTSRTSPSWRRRWRAPRAPSSRPPMRGASGCRGAPSSSSALGSELPQSTPSGSPA